MCLKYVEKRVAIYEKILKYFYTKGGGGSFYLEFNNSQRYYTYSYQQSIK